MSYRVQCSACGKVMTLEDDAAGSRLVCIACGARLEAPPPPIVQAAEAPGEGQGDVVEVGAPAAVAATAAAPKTNTKPAAGLNRTTVITAAAVSFAIVAVSALVVLAILSGRRGDSEGRRSPGDRTVTSAEMRANADLLKLKSEAEALAIEGQLAEAHEKYRQLQALAVGRDIKDPLLWDIMERAKLDQDNVYMLLLRKQIPPGENPGAAFVVPPYAQPGTPGNPPLPSQAHAPAHGEAPAEASQTGGNAEQAQADGSDAPATQQIAASQPNMPTLVANVPPADSITDEQVDAAMKKGVEYLLGQMKDGQLVEQPGVNGVKREGMNALVVYSLLTSGQVMKDERLSVRGDYMKGLIEKMKSHGMKVKRGDVQQPVTYARSLRAAALAHFNRPEDRKVLKDDVDWLVAASFAGAYTYDDQFTHSGSARGNDEAPDARALAGTDDAPVRFADLDGSDGAQVFLMHGIHDANGRELYVPMGPMSSTPPITQYPQRPMPPMANAPTTPPGLGRPRPTQPPGIPPQWYGNRQGMGDMPGQTPVREGAGGSMSSGFPWDNSNSQYGLLGVWAGAEVGMEVPVRYWKDVERHWTQSQLTGGEWGYMPRDKTGSFAMTCGGISSLFVTHDWLVAPTFKETGREPLTPPLAAGLKWLERADNCVNTPNPKTHYIGYDLFGLERVALASGFKYFGKHDWYRELAANVLGTQWPTGAWGREPDGPDAIVDTAYTLMFLARGRYPILMNKLRFDRSEVTRLDGKPAPGYWANRPRDLANLTRYASRSLERGLNWQVVSLEMPWHTWLDSPVLYIASHQAPLLEDKDYQNLRQYVEGGGMIFTHADTGAAPFNRWVAKLVEQVCPGRKLEDLPEDHPLYSVNYKIKQPRPKVQAVSNGSRLLLVHSPADLSIQWQQRGEKLAPETFKLGVNLFLYAAGKSDWRDRLSSPYVAPPKGEPMGKLAVARVKYDGNWDPEPGAWGRFGRMFQWQTQFGVETKPVEMKDLVIGSEGPGVAHLTGTATVKFGDEQVAAVKKFVEDGGVLLVDACGGSQAFNDSVRDGLLGQAFPGAVAEKVAADHPILRPAGEKQSLAPKVRAFVADAAKDGGAGLSLIKAGKGFVVVSALDLTTGMVGSNAWGVSGYEPASAQAIVRNVLLWAQGRLDEGK